MIIRTSQRTQERSSAKGSNNTIPYAAIENATDLDELFDEYEKTAEGVAGSTLWLTQLQKINENDQDCQQRREACADSKQPGSERYCSTVCFGRRTDVLK